METRSIIRRKEAELLHDSKEVLEHILSVKEAIAELEGRLPAGQRGG